MSIARLMRKMPPLVASFHAHPAMVSPSKPTWLLDLRNARRGWATSLFRSGSVHHRTATSAAERLGG
jgi:hypothetical protein